MLTWTYHVPLVNDGIQSLLYSVTLLLLGVGAVKAHRYPFNYVSGEGSVQP